jgi:hypothetical protein
MQPGRICRTPRGPLDLIWRAKSSRAMTLKRKGHQNPLMESPPLNIGEHFPAFIEAKAGKAAQAKFSARRCGFSKSAKPNSTLCALR